MKKRTHTPSYPAELRETYSCTVTNSQLLNEVADTADFRRRCGMLNHTVQDRELFVMNDIICGGGHE